jgi:hypothetical protein
MLQNHSAALHSPIQMFITNFHIYNFKFLHNLNFEGGAALLSACAGLTVIGAVLKL